MKKLLSKIRLWIRWRQECRKITCFLHHRDPSGKEALTDCWFILIKHTGFNIRESYYIGHILNQDDNSSNWAIKTKKEVKERIRNSLKVQILSDNIIKVL